MCQTSNKLETNRATVYHLWAIVPCSKKKHSELKSRCTLFFQKQKMRQRAKNVGRKPRQFSKKKACFLSFTALKGSRVIPRILFAVNPLENLSQAEGEEDQSRGVRNRRYSRRVSRAANKPKIHISLEIVRGGMRPILSFTLALIWFR